MDSRLIGDSYFMPSYTTGIYARGAIASGLNYNMMLGNRMVSFDAGLKYRGVAVEGEYCWRRIDDFRGTAVDRLSFDRPSETGFQVQAAAMVMPKTLQLDVSGSKVFGEWSAGTRSSCTCARRLWAR